MLDIIKQDMKNAMRAREKARTTTLRMLIAALQNERISLGRDLTQDDFIALFAREAKRRREAAVAYREGDRIELAEKEEAELAVIAHYLPKEMTEDEVRAIAREVIAAVQPTSARDMGKVMGQVMPKIKGRFDGKAASGLIRAEFNAAIS